MRVPQPPPDAQVFTEYKHDSFGPLTRWEDDRQWAVAPDGRFASVPFFPKLAEAKRAFAEGLVVDFCGEPALRLEQRSHGLSRWSRRVFVESLLDRFAPDGAFMVLYGLGDVKLQVGHQVLLKNLGRRVKSYPPATDDLAIAFVVASKVAYSVLRW